MIKVAILVDGGFYKKRAKILFGEKSPAERANELFEYCLKHLNPETFHCNKDELSLYRIFYYDCPPAERTVFHPLTNKNIDLSKSDIFHWTNEFFLKLSSKRKVAIRRGELSDNLAEFILKPKAVKKLCRKEIGIEDLTEADFHLEIKQKGVDMRIGLDIASMATKKLVDAIVLIAGDSDFVPAAKHARREGIDFILDPMWHIIKPSLCEHIDGLKTYAKNPDYETSDSNDECFNAFKNALIGDCT